MIQISEFSSNLNQSFLFRTYLAPVIRDFRRGGGLKVYHPSYEIFIEGYLPPTWNFAKQNFFVKKMPLFQKIFGTSWGYHESAVKLSNKFWPLPPLKMFLNPYPPPKIFGQAHVWLQWPCLWRTDNIIQMITLTVITISGNHYISILPLGWPHQINFKLKKTISKNCNVTKKKI